MFGRRREASKLSFRLARGAIKTQDCERGCGGFNMNDNVEKIVWPRTLAQELQHHHCVGEQRSNLHVANGMV
jgi:hypothetical protein